MSIQIMVANSLCIWWRHFQTNASDYWTHDSFDTLHVSQKCIEHCQIMLLYVRRIWRKPLICNHCDKAFSFMPDILPNTVSSGKPGNICLLWVEVGDFVLLISSWRRQQKEGVVNITLWIYLWKRDQPEWCWPLHQCLPVIYQWNVCRIN